MLGLARIVTGLVQNPVPPSYDLRKWPTDQKDAFYNSVKMGKATCLLGGMFCFRRVVCTDLHLCCDPRRTRAVPEQIGDD